MYVQQQQQYLEQWMCKIIASLQQKHPRRVIVNGMNGRHNFGCTTSCQSSILPPKGKCATRSHQHQMSPASVRQNNIAIRHLRLRKSTRNTGQAAQLFHIASVLRHHTRGRAPPFKWQPS